MLSSVLLVFVGLVLVALAAEYIDSTLGMGYGTTLTPLLLMLGWQPLQIIPAILFSELLTGLAAAFFHHAVGNVDLLPRRPSKGILLPSANGRHLPVALRVGLVIGSCSLVGTIVAVALAIQLPVFWLKLYIGVLVTAMGLLILFTRKRELPFSWKRIIGLSTVASFNKGLSGGGYGPIVTSGQILSGVGVKSAIAITSLAEGLTCLVGFSAYLVISGWPGTELLLPLSLGGLLSVPLAGFTVRRMRERNLRHVIGWVTLALGAFTLYKVLF
ncbi:MAG: sulfite exporter TauE/SafE family protein [Candidatus Cloacimonetes bacterium]|nr:sulfite exporter TauE/SafE family protein [Candidatus Cloacimonadota bacterium]